MLPFNSEEWNWQSDSRLVILTGAGVSAESGIKTFRDEGGLWEGENIADVATPMAFKSNPKRVIRFYNERRLQLKTVEPNTAHRAIAECSERLRDRFHLITQNVDDLHQRLNTNNTLAMHGELKKLRCIKNGHIEKTTEIQSFSDECRECHSPLRPHIVWFGEIPFFMDEIHTILSKCTHFIYCGTSSLVYPAAGFKAMAKLHGAKVLCLNYEVPNYDTDTDFYIEGKAGVYLPEVLKGLN